MGPPVVHGRVVTAGQRIGQHELDGEGVDDVLVRSSAGRDHIAGIESDDDLAVPIIELVQVPGVSEDRGHGTGPRCGVESVVPTIRGGAFEGRLEGLA